MEQVCSLVMLWDCTELRHRAQAHLQMSREVPQFPRYDGTAGRRAGEPYARI